MKQLMICIFLISCFINLPLFVLAQRDTVYLDYNWSICEQPVASYYRVCSIDKGQLVFYKGPFEDYYINGQLEMIGSYDDKGKKEGSFIAYYINGNKKEEGDYYKDQRIGLWSFYKQNGNLNLQLFCTSNHDFVPQLLINNNGDSLVKEGNGYFVLNTKDYPGLFTYKSSCRMEGAVVNGKKDGTIKYFSCNDDEKVDYSESYRKGEFKTSSSTVTQIANIPFATIELTSEKLEKLESFYHVNPLFDFSRESDKLALDYVVNKNFYGIVSDAKEFEENYRIFYYPIAYTLNSSLAQTNTYSFPSFQKYEVDRVVFNKVKLNNQKDLKARSLSGNITITIDTGGYVSNSVFKGNFYNHEIEQINYYLSTIYGLKPFTEGATKISKNINIKVYSFIDSSVQSASKSYTYRYIVENGDKIDIEPLAGTPDIEAKFPGGQNAWIKYLQKNLQSELPGQRGAAPGNYTVIVSFTVNEDGFVSNVKALNDPGYGTAEEAVRVISKGPSWTPAVFNGKNVTCTQKQSITFQIDNGR